jgi:hypothetical protein
MRLYKCVTQSCPNYQKTVAVEPVIEWNWFLAYPNIVCRGCGGEPWLISDSEIGQTREQPSHVTDVSTGEAPPTFLPMDS